LHPTPRKNSRKLNIVTTLSLRQKRGKLAVTSIMDGHKNISGAKGACGMTKAISIRQLEVKSGLQQAL